MEKERDTFAKMSEALERGSGRCVVLREGEPYCVALAWVEYEKLKRELEELRRVWEKVGIKDVPV